MSPPKSYFFCGIGGSGMLPLALIVAGRGHEVKGSDRALDQARTGAKFDYLRAQGVDLFAQDGSGLTRADQILVASAAVEDGVPDMIQARALGAPIVRRPTLLAELFNAARVRIGVAGTSGKSTTTAMIGWILSETGCDPTIMNGAVMTNFATPDALFASARVGDPDLFVSEVDESDGSIAQYDPSIALVTNISLDHKSMEELRTLFAAYVSRADRAVLNLDNAETARIALQSARDNVITYSLEKGEADLYAEEISQDAAGIAFDVVERAGHARASVRLSMIGAHNVSNALAALAAARALGVGLTDAAAALQTFRGVRRRLEYVGAAAGVSVIDDFAHNPDKIEASLAALHAAPGRLLIFFQPHGYGPLRLMKDAFIDVLTRALAPDDVLILPDPAYFGGTADKSVSSEHIVAGVAARGREASHIPARAEAGAALLEWARPGDRIVVMGARDDTLSEFARDLLARLGAST